MVPKNTYPDTKKLIRIKVPKNTMRLLSQKHSEYKGKHYEKFWVVIPAKLIEKLGWKKGEDLEAEVEGNKLVIEKD